MTSKKRNIELCATFTETGPTKPLSERCSGGSRGFAKRVHHYRPTEKRPAMTVRLAARAHVARRLTGNRQEPAQKRTIERLPWIAP
jgi:hypothetical protein